MPGRDLRKMPALGKAELNKELDLSAHVASPRVGGLCDFMALDLASNRWAK